MKRTIRNPRVERRAVRAAQHAMGRRPGVGPGLFKGMANAIAIIAAFVGFGLVLVWASEALCFGCPGYACSSNADCATGACACAKLEGQPYGSCVPAVGVSE